ncbi:MAG: hypothetical protein ABIE84_05125, partial [bacterium]
TLAINSMPIIAALATNDISHYTGPLAAEYLADAFPAFEDAIGYAPGLMESSLIGFAFARGKSALSTVKNLVGNYMFCGLLFSAAGPALGLMFTALGIKSWQPFAGAVKRLGRLGIKTDA